MYFTYFIFVSLSLSFFTLSLHCLLCLLRYEGKNRQGHWVCCHVDAYNKQFYVKTTPSSYHVITMFSTLKGRTGIGGWWLMILVQYESYVRVLPVSLRTIIVVYTIPYLKTQDTTIYHTWYIHTIPRTSLSRLLYLPYILLQLPPLRNSNQPLGSRRFSPHPTRSTCAPSFPFLLQKEFSIFFLDSRRIVNYL